MNLRPVRTLAAVGAALASLFTAGVASAQYYAPAPAYGPAYVAYADGPRFRGGVNLGGGGLFVPGEVKLGKIGVEGQLGVQINNQWGIYATPSFDILGGDYGGLNVGAAVLVEFTLPGVPLSFGIGPTAGDFVVFGQTTCVQGICAASEAGGAYYGAKIRFEVHPVIVRQGWRRRALTIGLDLDVLTGDYGATDTSGGTVVAANSFGIAPRIWIGYTAF
jgi:hypothetical protein